jgi:hypothetical protein
MPGTRTSAAVQEGLKASPLVDGATGHFRDLVENIIDSPKLLEAIAAICAILKIKNKILGLDCPTRWNSTWEIISTIIDMKPALLELLRRIRERHDGFSISPNSELAEDIDSMTWSALEDFCSFLKAFKDATLLMSASEYPTLGLVIPVYLLIDKHVQNAVDSTSGFSITHMMSFALAVKKQTWRVQ